MLLESWLAVSGSALVAVFLARISLIVITHSGIVIRLFGIVITERGVVGAKRRWTPG